MSSIENHLAKEDKKAKKIHNILKISMISLLKERNFRQITVIDICKRALVARATFYSYFTDKYDFLKWLIVNIYYIDVCISNDTYDVIAEEVNRFVAENKRLIKNIFADIDNYTLDAIFEALCLILHITIQDMEREKQNTKYIVQSHFYIYGIIYYIMWQVKNDFPQNVKMMNAELYEIIKFFQEWNERGEITR